MSTDTLLCRICGSFRKRISIDELGRCYRCAKQNLTEPSNSLKLCAQCNQMCNKSSYSKTSDICNKCRAPIENPNYQKKTRKRNKSNSVLYREYIKSNQWYLKRKEYWNSEIMRECYICGDPWIDFKGKELHHRTYRNLGQEQLNDLVPVCPEHHTLITQRWKITKRKERKTLWQITDIVRDEWRK